MDGIEIIEILQGSFKREIDNYFKLSEIIEKVNKLPEPDKTYYKELIVLTFLKNTGTTKDNQNIATTVYRFL